MRLKEHVHWCGGVSVIGLNSYETLFSITKGFNVSLWLILFRYETRCETLWDSAVVLLPELQLPIP